MPIFCLSTMYVRREPETEEQRHGNFRPLLHLLIASQDPDLAGSW
jgi:hypothetical protein